MANGYECYQCLDTGLLIAPMQGKNGMTYDYMFQCSCSRGGYHSQLPPFNIKIQENRDFLKKLSDKNYKMLSEGIKTRLDKS